MASRSEKEKIVLEEIEKLKEKIRAADAADKATLEAKLEILQESLKVLQSSISYLKEQHALTEELAKAYERVAKNNKGNADIQLVSMEQQKLAAQKMITILGEEAKQLDEIGELTEDILKDNMKLVKDQEIIIANLDTEIKKTEEWHATIEEAVSISRDLGKSLGKAMAMPKTHDFVGQMQKVVKSVQGGTASFEAFWGAGVSAIASQFVNNIISMAIAVADMETGFQRATGASKSMGKMVSRTYNATKKYGVTAEEASKATQALRNTYTDFTMLAESEQQTLAQTTALLAEWGISAGDVAKGTQIATKMLGVSASQVSDTHLEIKTFAHELGVAPAKMAAEFAKAGGQLAKFGDQGVKAFKDLQHIAKITGMEMDKVLRITNKFDTFEGAAEQAGKLNAALGGNFVNAMDLMMATDPAERFEMIRSSILDAGLSFDTMSYYQKNFYKDALGLSDVGELALLMSGNMNMLGGATQKTQEDYEAMAAQTLALQSIQEKFNAAMADATPMLESLISLTRWISENFTTIAKVLKVLLPTLAVIKTGMMGLNMAIAINELLTTKSVKKWQLWVAAAAGLAFILFVYSWGSNFAAALIVVSLAMLAVSQMTEKSGKSFAKAAPGILAFGAAVVMVGYGISIAAKGIAQLVQSFAGLDPAALQAVTTTLAGFTVAFMLLIGALTILALSGVGWIAVGIFLAFGAALLMVGAAVFLATTGLSNLISSVAGVDTSGFVKLGLGLGAIAVGLQLFALPWMGIAILAFWAFGKVLTSLITKLNGVVGPVTAFFTALSGMGNITEPLTNTVDGLEKLSKIDLSSLAEAGAPLKNVADSFRGLSGINFGVIAKLGPSLEKAIANYRALSEINFQSLTEAGESVAPFTALVDSLSMISTVDLTSTASQIKNIVAEVNKLDKTRAMEFTTAMRTVTTAIVEVRNTPAPAPTPAGTGTKGATVPTNLVANVYIDKLAMEDLIANGSVEAISEIVATMIGD